ncbi:MAG: hypothetical protein JXB05_01595 [Myxococcaceae bacterium]|nr:hypothetical protein [Myxococcaceae bacterium]
MTAYRLVTGHSPELAEPSQDEAGTWHLQGLSSPAPHLLNPRVSPQLNAVILRMLSMRPEARGTAAQLTAALEQASQLSTPESTRPLFAQQTGPVIPSHKEYTLAEVRAAVL